MAYTVRGSVAKRLLVAPTIQSFMTMTEPPGCWPQFATAGGCHESSGVMWPFVTM